MHLQLTTQRISYSTVQPDSPGCCSYTKLQHTQQQMYDVQRN
jgi:hypothetical protein